MHLQHRCRYKEIHFELAQRNKAILANVQMFCLLASTTITALLLYFDEEHPQRDRVVLIAGSIAAAIGAALTWSKFALYDSLGAAHEVSFRKFVRVCADIEALFVKLRYFTHRAPKQLILEALDECIDLDENPEDDDEDDDDDDDDDRDDSDHSSDGGEG